MNTFDPTKHPRETTGEFTAKRNDAPTGQLTAERPAGDGITPPTDQEMHNAVIEAYYRQGDREITDAAARTIAADMLLNPGERARHTTAGYYPLLRQVASGEPIDHTDLPTVDAFHGEIAMLRHFDTAGTGSIARRNLHMDMLATWGLHGGGTDR